jgi:exodeoxyribonuclease VII large subunit
MSGPPETGEIWSVTQVTQRLQAVLARAFPPLWVEGEISNATCSQAGHRYFTLKDDRNQIKVALFRNRARDLRFEPADGHKVVVFGTVEVYGPRSEYQIIGQRLLPVGQGELELAFRQLHTRLEAEGLFAPERKRPLPTFPRRIGVVTSAHGAAVRDILKVLRRRAPHVQVVVAPAVVQGEGAAASIARAIAAFNRLRQVDLLIVGRGGGSLEDLWAFNEETTVRAVAGSELPIISAVGHEVDVTLCDLAADLRAATPSVAAELAVRDRREWLSLLQDADRRLVLGARACVALGRDHLRQLVRRYGFRKPEDALTTFAQTIDRLSSRLERARAGQLEVLKRRLQSAGRHPVLRRPSLWLAAGDERLDRIARRFHEVARRTHSRRCERLERSAGRLWALSPRAVLERGYAVIFDPAGKLVDSVEGVQRGATLTTWLRDGRLQSRVEEKESKQLWP